MGLTDWIRQAFGGQPAAAEPSEPLPRSRREQLRLERERAEEEGDKHARTRRVKRIRRDALDLICEASRASHPNEFGASMRAEGDTITEVILVPGTLGGDKHAILPLGYLPVDFSIVGTVHSHPGPYAIPSDADKQLFKNFGHTHIIIAEPYTHDTWLAYDHDSRSIELEIVED